MELVTIVFFFTLKIKWKKQNYFNHKFNNLIFPCLFSFFKVYPLPTPVIRTHTSDFSGRESFASDTSFCFLFKNAEKSSKYDFEIKRKLTFEKGGNYQITKVE